MLLSLLTSGRVAVFTQNSHTRNTYQQDGELDINTIYDTVMIKTQVYNHLLLNCGNAFDKETLNLNNARNV